MCRFFGSAGSSSIHQTEFEGLTLLSKKGGPDSSEYFSNNCIQFGFNRLAILDTSAHGNQPFISADGRWVLMLNGEVYNFIELSGRYSITGLKSGSDVEVVLRLVEKIGFEQTLHELNGMFAIACWDNHQQQLYLARDFAGIKPLFYSESKNGIVFGSQFNQLLKHPWCSGWQWSTIGLSEYLQLGYMSPPFTVAEGVKQLGVGQYLVYSLKSKQSQISDYQRFFEESGIVSEFKRESVSVVSNAVNSAVKRQLVSDVPLGVFLSGGIDSTLVAATAKNFNPEVTAVTIGFDDKRYDESEKAREYAKHLKIKNHHIEKFGNESLLDVFVEHFDNLTEPIADYSSLPTYLVSKIARKTNTVMLSGDGGDELFWGYPRFLTFSNSAKYFSVPGSMNRKLIKKVLKSLDSDVTGFLGEKNLGEANLAFQRYIDPESVQRYTGNFGISEESKRGYQFYGTNSRDTLNYLRKNEFYFHLQKILVKVDRMSMANSLEVRVPLLDKEVVQVSEKFYSELGGNNTTLKHLLKEVLYQYVPKSVVEQQKRGFTPPLLAWAENELRNEIETTLANCTWLDHHVIKDYYQEKSISLEHLWTVYVLVKWYNNQAK